MYTDLQQIEQAFLGCLIASDDAFNKSPQLQAAHFILPVHGNIYDSIRRRHENREAIEARLIALEFDDHQELREVGGGQYIHDIAGSIVSTFAAPDYAREIYKAHCKRAMETHATTCDGSPESLADTARLLAELADAADNKRDNGLNIIQPASWQGKPIPTRKWIVKDWIPVKCVTLLYGDGGTGKSLLAMQLLTATVLGEPWLDYDVPQLKAFGFFCEDDEEELHRRQDRVNQKIGCDFDALTQLRIYSGVGEDNVFMNFDGQKAHGEITSLYRKVEKAVLQSGAQVVIFDTAADIFGGDEIKKSQVRGFLNMLGGLALKIDGAVIVCAHPSQSGMATGRGDGGNLAWNNTARSRLYFEHIADDETGDLRILSRKKSNYAKKDEKVTVRYSDGVFVRENESESSIVEGIKAKNLRRYIVGEVEKRQDSERWLSMVAQTRSQGRYLPDALHRLSEYKRNDLKKAAVQMLQDGEIEIFTRNKKQGLRKGGVSHG